MAETANCIYCGKTFDPSKGQGDHVMSAAWGDFRNDFRFRGICSDCNNKIGKAKQHMLQCGPERIFREMVVPSSSRSRGKRASWVGANGLPPPKFQAIVEEGVMKVRHLDWHLDYPRKVSAPDQFVIYDEGGVSHPIELFPGISPDTLRKKASKFQGKVIKQARLHCDESRWDDYMKTIKKVWNWPESKQVELPRTEPGIRDVSGKITSRFKVHYFRAMAKIAFHYYLATSERSEGNEPCFAGIRDFIMNGKDQDKDKLFMKQHTFEDNDPFTVPSWWLHILAAKEEDGIAIGYVCLFQGPVFRGVKHQVLLGELPYRSIVSPRTAWAHSYEYDRPVPSRGKVGTVHRIQVFKKQTGPWLI